MMFYHYAEHQFKEMQKLQYLLSFLQTSTSGPSSPSLVEIFSSLDLDTGALEGMENLPDD
jgi:hypothetical protein